MRREIWMAAACVGAVAACVCRLWPEPHARTTSSPVPSPSLTRAPRQRDAFWQEARVPEPGRFREPTAIAPTTDSSKPTDHQARTEELLAKGDSNRLTVELVDWFSTDPAGARDWLAGKESLGFCQPALKMVAVSFATRGDCDLALEWTELLESPAERDEAVARIYSTGFTTGRFSSEDLAAAPLSDESRRAILDGKAND